MYTFTKKSPIKFYYFVYAYLTDAYLCTMEEALVAYK